jgi:hypothetical protein
MKSAQSVPGQRTQPSVDRARSSFSRKAATRLITTIECPAALRLTTSDPGVAFSKKTSLVFGLHGSMVVGKSVVTGRAYPMANGKLGGFLRFNRAVQKTLSLNLHLQPSRRK